MFEIIIDMFINIKEKFIHHSNSGSTLEMSCSSTSLKFRLKRD